MRDGSKVGADVLPLHDDGSPVPGGMAVNSSVIKTAVGVSQTLVEFIGNGGTTLDGAKVASDIGISELTSSAVLNSGPGEVTTELVVSLITSTAAELDTSIGVGVTETEVVGASSSLESLGPPNRRSTRSLRKSYPEYVFKISAIWSKTLTGLLGSLDSSRFWAFGVKGISTRNPGKFSTGTSGMRGSST